MIKTIGLTKDFKAGKEMVSVLKGVEFTVKEGEFVGIIGPSGSGKTTLLHLLAGLDTPTEGSIQLNGDELSSQSEKQRTIFRRQKIGLVFQNYQLLPTLTVFENIAFPLHADGKKTSTKDVNELLEAVDLKGYEKRFPNELSGGQQQRVAIARALIHKPAILLADEPTGNLDRERSSEILDLLAKLHQERNQTIVMVTHDMFAAGYSDRIVLFKDGVIEAEVQREDEEYAFFLSRFMA
ncbi:ABC transporter ATP-binding protein [Gracilibacillus thailandensis]|uniref:ATP-binding cassette domain-containing protein n=1 Tax=Gracilibacillus thailandensis TaxID=563735 RepID=A0A6N7R166_9BACI|nr:ABC transporter ATP-binding protein [Gracilibacillus thailandensis]MRI66890.1 ATP-binding cassette domain-containing protein [Gracilibacillus thailandensis]